MSTVSRFAHAERLTDGDWKKPLDSPKRPDVPEWVKPSSPPAASPPRS